jgi:hypothetical protein
VIFRLKVCLANIFLGILWLFYPKENEFFFVKQSLKINKSKVSLHIAKNPKKLLKHVLKFRKKI